MLIFEKSVQGNISSAQAFKNPDSPELAFDQSALRDEAPLLPRVSELETVRHYTSLSQKNFCIDTNFYPLGSCSMKYNPAIAHQLATLEGFSGRHPQASDVASQGFLHCMYECQEYFRSISGMPGVALSPMAGAQGELAGVLMIKSYHKARQDDERTEMLIPDAAHGTNPATAQKAGFTVREIKTGPEGDIDIQALKEALGPKTAGIMLTNPSTLGVFEREILTVAQLVHDAGGLLYYDGANLNAILGKSRPGDMGFDVMHINTHKTFATPHGGGGPGAGPIMCSQRLIDFLPMPVVTKNAERYTWKTAKEAPQTIGRMSHNMGNAGVLLRAYIYMRLLGQEGMTRVSENAVLNANYMMKALQAHGFELAFPTRRASHEFIVTLKQLAKDKGVTALDFAKRLLDFGCHAPTIYFPLLVPECLLIEPTETESKRALDEAIAHFAQIFDEAHEQPSTVTSAPHSLPVGRVDEVLAAKNIKVRESELET
ncbi:MAG: glycine dehydrogenase (aminomethyl-transferring) [Legionellales bacterium]|nr:glycine dehydrogenase (aminomethyl-transferring) [Legionellales bacterium]